MRAASGLASGGHQRRVARQPLRGREQAENGAIVMHGDNLRLADHLRFPPRTADLADLADADARQTGFRRVPGNARHERQALDERDVPNGLSGRFRGGVHGGLRSHGRTLISC